MLVCGGQSSKHHGDVRAKLALDIHGFLRPQKEQRTVQVRPKLHAVRLDLANVGQAEDLEPAAVRQDRLRPIDKLVQPAGGADDVQPGPNVQVISVAENDLRAHLAQFTRVERLDAALRAHRHEHGRIDNAVRSGQPAQARAGAGISLEKFEHGRLETNELAFARGFDLEMAVTVFHDLAGVLQHRPDLRVVVIRVVVKQEKPLHFGLQREFDRVIQAGVAPPAMLFILVAVVLRIHDEHVGVAQEFEDLFILVSRVFSLGGIPLPASAGV